MNQIKNFFKKIWFPVFIIIVILVYFLSDKNIAIYMLIGVIIILILQMVYEYSKTRSFRNYLTKFPRIDDETLSIKLGDDLENIKNNMSDIMREGKAKGLIVLLGNRYISYNPKMVDILRKILIERDFPTSEIFRVLEKYDITTKEELRAIKQGITTTKSK